MTSGSLSDVQLEVARLFFGMDSARGFLVAGGAALLASDLTDRPTEDLDLFASTPITSVAPAAADFESVLQTHGFEVEVLRRLG
jgi:hypothetical protein